MQMTKQNREKAKEGFTLLELLIVITIIAILSVALVFILNPAETLQKSRDTQRMADLSTLKTALGIYLTSTSSPQLDGTSGTANDKCVGGSGTATIFLSADTTSAGSVTDASYPTGYAAFAQPSTVAAASSVNGTGWLPVKLTSIVGGSPISSMPVDPVNKVGITTSGDVSALSSVTNGALMYRYACKKSPLGFEVDARLESSAYGVGGSDDRASKDGGDNSKLFEVGTDLTILPSSNDF